jgi:glycosyltransferase involved in cell wall biosynthesis
MKKVLVITYYWPPSGGTGVQRWMHFSLYLKKLGWDIVIFTPINPEAPIIDEKLKELVKDIRVEYSKIWEPFGLYKLLTRKDKKNQIQPGFIRQNKKKSILERFALWIRANLFIPDAKSNWIKPAVVEILKLHQKERFTHVISSGPPHTVHLIAQSVKNKTGIKWLADFRDPWTNIDWFSKLPMTNNTIKKHFELQKSVLDQADIVVAVTSEMAREFSEFSKREINVVTNGYAPNDFKDFKSIKTNKIIFFHHGSMNADRNPFKLWEYLGKKVNENESWKKQLEIQLIGSVDFSVLESIELNNLNSNLILKPFLPHDKVIEALSYATICILPLNNTPNATGIMPNKLFEYLATGKPILAVGPKNGDVAKSISELKNSCIFDFDEEIDDLKIQQCIQIGIVNEDVQKYNRENLASEINQLLISLN